MTNIFYKPTQYKCKKCGMVVTLMMWSDEIANTTHTCDCGRKLTVKNLYVRKPKVLHGIRTDTKNR